MSGGYVPLFSGLTRGSLQGKWPDIGLWAILLSLTDRYGIIEATYGYVAAVSGLPLNQVQECFERFCEPDPDSGSPEEEGRKLLKQGAHKWLVVNHGRYREKARLMSKNAAEVASGKAAKRMRAVRRCSPVSAAVRPSDSDLNLDLDKKEAHYVRQTRARRCPTDWIPAATVLQAGTKAGLSEQEVSDELEKFRDWEFRDPHSDWNAAARTWLRNSVDRRGGNGGGKPRAGFVPVSKSAALSAEADRNLAEYRRLKGET